MRAKIFTILAYVALLLTPFSLLADSSPSLSGHECVDMESIYELSEEARLYNIQLEEFTQWHIKNNNSLLESKTIVIPVVFHVFGDDFSGHIVNNEIIELALRKVNEDFKGLNDDFDDVDTLFLGRRGILNIEFRLARVAPNGESTTGVLYYADKEGLAKTDPAIHEFIESIAWDNYKYMNVYICSDLIGDGVTNNSGFAWYPNKYMSDMGIARVVYNGRYLYGNIDKEFASVLTHEFGHWLNLIHTFQDGCKMPNDYVDDTPACDKAAMGCRDVKNCQGLLINGENYMDYNSSCYKMFTQGQVARMLAALESETRKPLWDSENLIRTGTDYTSAVNDLTSNKYLGIFPNPATEYIQINIVNKGLQPLVNNEEIKIFNTFGECVSTTPSAGASTPQEGNLSIDISHLPRGVYYIRIGNQTQMFVKM
ncbi:MAG: T9SS type A sorting domain-containing protein [Candidatus Kapabacteria bacterium]|nr:T9SS type A sorting domain-containing protein [Candidatus Kapabacteria bacterium]